MSGCLKGCLLRGMLRGRADLGLAVLGAGLLAELLAAEEGAAALAGGSLRMIFSRGQLVRADGAMVPLKWRLQRVEHVAEGSTKKPAPGRSSSPRIKRTSDAGQAGGPQEMVAVPLHRWLAPLQQPLQAALAGPPPVLSAQSIDAL